MPASHNRPKARLKQNSTYRTKAFIFNLWISNATIFNLKSIPDHIIQNLELINEQHDIEKKVGFDTKTILITYS